MKRATLSFLFTLLLSVGVQADVLIGWHTPDASGTNTAGNDITPDTTFINISGALTGGREFEVGEGSADDDYGNVAIPGTPAHSGRVKIRLNDTVEVSITNNTGSDLQLDTLHFDYSSVFLNSPTAFTVEYRAFGSSNSLGDTDTVILTVAGLTPGQENGNDFPDYDADITAELADSIVGDGETALFRFNMTTAGSNWTEGSLDNIAFSGFIIVPSSSAPIVNLDDHATDPATDASLDGISIDSIWTLNAARGATYGIEDDAGDKALLMDDINDGNDGEIEFATLTLDTPASFANERVVFEFKTIARRDFDDRGYIFAFKDSLGNEAGRLEWISDLNGAKNGVYLNGTANTPASGDSIGDVTMTATSAWSANSENLKQLSVTFDNGNISVDFDGVIGSDAVLNSATDIASMLILSNGSNTGNRGIYIDDINPRTTAAAPAIGWHSGSSAPDILTSGLSTAVQIIGSGSFGAAQGSTDGSYGTYYTNTPSAAGAFELFNNDVLQLQVTNNSGGKVRLNDLRLDFNRRLVGSPTDVSVNYASGNLDDNTIVLGALTSQAAIESDLADYNDLDLELRQKLFDVTLDDGESTTFEVTVSGASGSTAAYIDNISILATLTSYITGPATPPAVATVRKPNVVVFYADDLGVGDVSVSGYATTEVSTPNIDLLASQGMRFTDAHTAFATCAPSRYGVLSGSMPFRGQRYNGTFRLEQSNQFKAGQKSTGHLFQEAGYRTAHVGKSHLGGELLDATNSRVSGTDMSSVDWLKGIADGLNGYLGFTYSFISHDGVQGPQYVYHENDFPVTNFAYSDTTNTWTWSAATSQAYLFLTDVGASDPTTGVIDLDPNSNSALSEILLDSEYGNGSGSNIAYGYGDFDTTRTGEVYMQAAKNFISDHMANHSSEPFYLHYASQAVHIPHTPDVTYFDDPVKGEEKTKHLDMIREMDLQLRDLVAHLTTEGVIDDTIIIFTSDNGGITKSLDVTNQNDPSDTVEHDGSGPFRGNKTSPYEGGTLVPFIIRWGDGTASGSIIPPGVVCEQVVSQMDLFPTFATMLDLPQPASQARDGTNILPYFLGQTITPLRDHLITGASYQNAYRFSYRLGGWKIIAADPNKSNANFTQYFNPTLPGAGVVEMYHYASDPYETTNLVDAPEYADIKQRILDSLQDKVETNTRSTPALDFDEDGLFDHWEKSVVGNLTTYDASLLTATFDSDGDGMTDRDEYAIRANPAVFDPITYQKAQLTNAGGQMTIGWNTQSGLFYTIKQSSDLSTWTPLGDILGTGGTLEYAVPSVDPKAFFRIIVE